MSKQSPCLRSSALVAAIFFAAVFPEAQAAVLARYEFTGDSLLSSDDDPANLTSTAGSFTDGPGFTGGAFNATGNPAPSRSISVAQVNSTSEAAAYGGEDYFEFTITPVSGYQLNLTSISLDFDASYSTALRGYGIRTSVDSFATPTVVITEAANTGTSNTFVNEVTDLSAAGFQNLTAPITFRITVFDNASVSTNNNRFDNVIVNGTVTPVPEPAGAGLFGLAGLALFLLRRR